MSESEDDAAPRHHHVDVREVLMDFDLEMDNSWPLDQIAFINAAGVNHHPNHPMSPILFSASDQPCSPLWAFCDAVDNDDKFAPSGGGVGGVGGGHVNGSAVADSSPRLLTSCDSHSMAEKPTENGDTKANPSPFSGLPPEHTEAYYRIKERMTQALRKFKDSTDQHVLAQVWAPVKNGCRYFLTTYGQPFVLDPDSNGLHQYRMASLMYKFSVDGGESNEELGLPGRVFQQKLPEWTPNVQYYSIREYPRLDHAQNFNVRGSLALPVFEPSEQFCVGVVELIMTSEKINYAPEVDKVCKALEAVNLRSAEIVDHTPTRICNEGRQSALTEILEILTAACENLKLPMAQTWVPCMHRNVLAHGGGLKKICTSIDASCMGQVCMSTNEVAFYIVDPHMWGFRGACLEHHLQKDQGVAGMAFSSRDACFCENITKFGKNNYPLVHYAKMFGLTGSFAICLESVYTGNDNYVLEFFLPATATGPGEQRRLLGSLLATMKKHLRSLKVVSGAGIDDEFYIEVVTASLTAGHESTVERIPIVHSNIGSPVTAPATNGVPEIVMRRETPRPGPALLLGNGEFENGGCDNVIVEGGSNANNNNNNLTAPESREAKKPSERKRGKTEKSISLEVLQQYFAGSLKDAAKSLGVCPTTMKRICRQHGISRWPSRKINKVNRSLTKLKRVIESVQGAEGAFSLNPLAATSPIPSNSRPSTSNGTNQQTSPIHSPFDQQPLLDCKDSPTHSSPRSGGGPHEIGFGLCNNNGTNNVKPSRSREASVGTPTSHSSCQGSPVNNMNGAIVVKADLSPESGLRPTHDHLFLIPDPIAGPLHEPRDSFGAMLIEDAGSSKDLRNLCPTEAILDEQVTEQYGWINMGPKQASTSNNNHNNNFIVPQSAVNDISKVKRQIRSVTIKATYREDIIRFRVSLSSSIVELNEEVAKRLKLDMGTFDMKYMDDDQEWVLIACEADLMECMDVCQSSGSNMIRLLIHDIMPNLGSSCESTE